MSSYSFRAASSAILWAAFLLHSGRGAIAAPAAQSGYVDSALCVSCHADIARKYRQTAMARSFSTLRPENAVEDFTARNLIEHSLSGRRYRMLRRGGEFFERRSQTDFDGKESNIVEKRIDFVIGSGDHARTYLHRTAEGRLIELPVSWYAENGGYWAMSPGYDRPGQEDFRRAIPFDCMFCHNAYPAAAPADDSASGAVFREKLPQGIDCQRCHGPGAAHIEAAKSGRSDIASIRRALVNPAALARDRQLEICMQCHLETTSRKLPNSIGRFDRAPFSYRPGQPLGDYLIYFDRAPGSGHEDDFEVAHAAYRLRKSACFQKSEMTCTTCHDPHMQLRGAEAVAHYVAVCRNCHASAHASGMPSSSPAGANCIECHMPRRRTDDAVHVVMTDHYIQRNKPDGNLLAMKKELDDERQPWHGEVVPYYPANLPRTPENELYLALAQVRDGTNLAAGIPRLEAAIARYRPARAEFDYELGVACSRAGRNEEAMRWYGEALRKRPGYRDALVKLTAALVSAGDLPQAGAVAEKAIAAHASDTMSMVNLGNIRLREGKTDEAIAILQRSLRIEPDQADAQNLLGLAELQRRNGPLAEAAFREAIRIDPDLAQAHNNLGNLLAGGRDFQEAAFHFEKAIESDPRYIEAYRSYSLVLAMTRDFDKAEAVLRKALTFAPDSTGARLDLADLLMAAGRIDQAESEYRAVTGSNPELAEAHYGRAGALLRLGRAAEAEQELRAALQKNPSYAEAHLELGLILMRSGQAQEGRSHLRSAAQSGDAAVREAALKALR